MPDRQPDHCARLAVLALDMLSALAGYEDDVGRPLQVVTDSELTRAPLDYVDTPRLSCWLDRSAP